MEDDWHPKPSNCNIGCRVPFLSFIADLIVGPAVADDPEAECHALMATLCSYDLQDQTRIISTFEELTDKFGLECVVFLPIAEFVQPTGKKCVLRSKLGEGKVEIRLRLPHKS